MGVVVVLMGEGKSGVAGRVSQRSARAASGEEREVPASARQESSTPASILMIV